MIGVWEEHAREFLLVFHALVVLVFELPIFFAPLAWARIMRFEIPADTGLVVYFARCFGAFVLIVAAFSVRAALTGEGLVLMFEITVAGLAMLTVVHVWGAVQRIWPVTETLEIALWLVLLVLALAFFPVSDWR